MNHAGELAALGAASCWVVSALSFESAGKRIGSLNLNLIRLTIALVPLALVGLIARGQPIPLDADAHTWTWLSVSALLGFVFGDLCLFRAFVLIGPRLGMLIMASAPMWTTLLGLAFLGESIEASDLAGMALTLAGIGWAIAQKPPSSEREPGAPTVPATINVQGVLLALCGALGQAGGLISSKHGMGDFDPFAATQIRVMIGVLGFAALITGLGWWGKIGEALRDRDAMKATTLGAMFGPFLGVGLSLVAVQQAPTGIAATLMATTPILMLPVAWIRGERFGLGGALGALLAFAGVVLLLT
ncbi:DMT family transporter [Nannocystaceae bacterium ST9]